MNIKEMHYDVKFKLNKVDSQQYRNLKIQEIDWALNEAQEVLVKLIAEPRIKNHLGFETSQRTIDDIKNIVVSTDEPKANIVVENNIVKLPEDYWFFLRGRITATKGKCEVNDIVFTVRQHDDIFEEDPFYKSSFEWRVVNGIFTEKGIELFDDGTFTNTLFKLSYIKKLPIMHNAEDTKGHSYKNLRGEILSGTSDCILSEHLHKDVVDLAVLFLSGQILTQNFQFNQAKNSINQLI